MEKENFIGVVGISKDGKFACVPLSEKFDNHIPALLEVSKMLNFDLDQEKCISAFLGGMEMSMDGFVYLQYAGDNCIAILPETYTTMQNEALDSCLNLAPSTKYSFLYNNESFEEKTKDEFKSIASSFVKNNVSLSTK